MLFEADIHEPQSFDAAIHGCHFVFHVAHPLHPQASQVSLSFLFYPPTLFPLPFLPYGGLREWMEEYDPLDTGTKTIADVNYSGVFIGWSYIKLLRCK